MSDPTNIQISAESQAGKSGWASHLHDAWPGGFVDASRRDHGWLPRISLFVNTKRVGYIDGPRVQSLEKVWPLAAKATNAAPSQRRYWRHPVWKPPGKGWDDEDAEQLYDFFNKAQDHADEAGLPEGGPAWLHIVVDEIDRWDPNLIKRMVSEAVGKGIIITVIGQGIYDPPKGARRSLSTKVFLRQTPDGYDDLQDFYNARIRRQIEVWVQRDYHAVSYRPGGTGWRRHRPLPDPRA